MSKIKEELKKAALKLFTKKGYAATSVREIVEEARTTKPCLYYYFKNKEAIYLEILKDSLREFIEILNKKFEKKLKPSEEIKELCRATFHKFENKKDVVRLIHSIFYGPPQGAPHFDFENFHNLFYEKILEKVKKAIEIGEFEKNNEEAIAFCIMSLWNGVAEMKIIFPKKYNYDLFFENNFNVLINSFKRRKNV